MNKRQNSILNYLEHSTRFVPIAEITDVIGCCEKTVRTDVQELNRFLARNSFAAQIQSKPGSGIRLQISDEESKRLAQLQEQNLFEIHPDYDRFYHAIIAILFQSQASRVDNLAEYLYTNTPQLQQELRRWSTMLDTFHLRIVRTPHLRVVGEEHAIRLCVNYYFHRLAQKAMRDRIGPFFLQNNEQYFRDLLERISESQGVKYTQNAIDQLCFYLGIMHRRVSLGQRIPDKSIPINPFFRSIQQELKQRFQLDFNDGEMQFLEQMTLTCALQCCDINLQARCDDSTEAFAGRLIDVLERQYGVIVPAALVLPLRSLLQVSKDRMKWDITVLNTTGDHVKSHCMAEHLMITRLFYDGLLGKDNLLHGTEYTRLTMLLLEAFEATCMKKRHRVALVVNSGMEQAVFAKYKLGKYVQEIDIVHIICENEVRAFENEVDFFISFEYIHTRVPYVKVSGLLLQEELQQITQFISGFDRAKWRLPSFLEGEQMLHRKIASGTYSDLLHRIYALLNRNRLVKMKREEFVYMIDSQRFFLNDAMVAAVFSQSVLKTCCITFDLEEPIYLEGSLMSRVQFLLLSPTEAAVLPELVFAWNNYLTTCNFLQRGLE